MTHQLPQDNQPMQTNLMQQQQQQLHLLQPALRSVQLSSPNMSPKLSSPQHHDQGQVIILQPIPPQPLFQADQTNSTTVIVHQNQDRHNTTMQHTHQNNEETQHPNPSLSTYNVQIPILSSGAPTSPRSLSGTTAKKGRFRVVKGSDNHPSSDPVTTNDILISTVNVGNPSSIQPHDITSTVKRGRFVVKKNNTPARGVTKIMNASSTCPDADMGGTSTKNCYASSSHGLDYTSDASLTPTKDTVSSSTAATTTTKQKGRFLVKTGGSTVNLLAQEAVEATLLECGTVTTTTTTGSSHQNACEEMIVPTILCTGEVDCTEEVGDGTPRLNPLSDTDKVNESSSSYNMIDSASSGLPALATKKKGRFVVKTGGANNNSNDASVHSTTDVNGTGYYTQEEIKSSGTGSNAHLAPPASSNQITMTVCNTNKLCTAEPVIGVSNSQTPYMQTMSQASQPQFASRSQLGPISEPPSNSMIDRNVNLPPAPRRVVTEDRATDYSVIRPVVVNSTSNGLSCSGLSRGGKNGHMIGSVGGVGKLLYYLDTLRSEVVESDRCISSLESDKRFLRDKNKELEARNKELERRLAEEKSLRLAIESKYRSLRTQISGTFPPAHEVLPGDSLDGRQLEISAKNNILQQEGAVGSQRSPVSHTPSFKNAKHNNGSLYTSPSLSRNSSFDKTNSTRSFTGHVSTAPSSPIRDTNSVVSSQTCASIITCENLSVGQKVPSLPPPSNSGPNATHFDPLGTPKCKVKTKVIANNDNGIISTADLSVAINRTAPEGLLLLPDDDVHCIPSTGPKHFDPMGTPKCNVKTVEDAISVLKTDGRFQLSELDISGNTTSVNATMHTNSQQTSQHNEDDPFDEIVRHTSRGS